MKLKPIGLRILFAACMAALPAVSSASPQAGDQGRAEFDAFFEKVNRAEAELFRGRPEALKALWTRDSDVTLFGVSGGTGEHGWDKVGARLDWTSTQ